ncbi:RimJ/RimL family protein N-acetyltransferase [Cellulomonas sp. PhB150]|nr:RimJ/RimL family protein N-acetyltransferase [Cellulomonas sp. PhB150]
MGTVIMVQGVGARGTIRTDRLLLRRFTAADGDALHAYLSRPEAVRFEPYGTQTRAQCHELALERAGDASFWAVCLRSDERLVGNLYLRHDDPQAWRSYTLGYVFDPAHWGSGYATEAAAALLDVCFRAWGAHRVSARCDPRNTRSWALLERLGMRREGHLRQVAAFSTDADGQHCWHDAYVYAAVESEWSGDEQRCTPYAGWTHSVPR